MVSERKLFDCATNFDVSLVKIFFSNAFSETRREEEEEENMKNEITQLTDGFSMKLSEMESHTFGIFAISKENVLDAGPFRSFFLSIHVIYIHVLIHDLHIHNLAMLFHPIFTGHRQRGITHRDNVRNQRW